MREGSRFSGRAPVSLHVFRPQATAGRSVAFTVAMANVAGGKPHLFVFLRLDVQNYTPAVG